MSGMLVVVRQVFDEAALAALAPVARPSWNRRAR